VSCCPPRRWRAGPPHWPGPRSIPPGWPGNWPTEDDAHLADASISGEYSLFGTPQQALFGVNRSKGKRLQYFRPVSGTDPAFDPLRSALEGRQRPLAHAYWADPAPCSMLIDEVEAIWSAIAEHDDWSPFESKIEAIRRFGDAMTSDAAA